MGAPMMNMGGPAMGHGFGQQLPMQQHQHAYDDDRPAGRTSAGLVIGILVAAVVLVGAGFGAVYLYSQSRTKPGGPISVARSMKSSGSAAAASSLRPSR